MSHKILKEYNLLKETYTILYNYCNDITFRQLKDELLQKFKLDKQTINCLDTLSKISDHITGGLSVPKERLNFYFKKFSTMEVFLAPFVLEPDEKYQLKTISKAKEQCENLTEAERAYKMSTYVKYSDVIYEEDNENVVELAVNDFYKFLNKSNLNAEDKWNIANILLDHKPYLEELIGILEEAYALLMECQKELEGILEDFYHYWSNKLSDMDIYDYMKEMTGSEFNKDYKNAVILPSLIHCNGISLYSEDDKAKGDIIYIGVLFNDNFNPGMKKEKDIFLTQYLKLLSDKSKFDILMNIKDKKVYGAELAKMLNLSTPTISYHMTALINAGLVNLERENTRIYYFINKEKIGEFIDTLQSLFL